MNDPYDNLPEFAYPGARALVVLHQVHLRQCLDTWKRAKAAQTPLPTTEDPSYASLETLLVHVLGAARGYMVWMCEVLALPDPEIRPTPDSDAIEAQSDEFIQHVLDRWRAPLQTVEEERFNRPEYPSRWGVAYCIDAMLEHAVMHPIRHEMQLAALLADSNPKA